MNHRPSQAVSSSCEFSTTLYGMQKEMMNYVSIVQRQLKSMLKDSLAVIGLSYGLDLKRSGTYDCKPDGSWNRTAEKMLQNFAGSGI